jgi:hypothetical protein
MNLRVGIVISQDPSRLARTMTELAPSGLDLFFWPGVVGALERQSPELSSSCARFCPDAVIGCGLAHKRLAKAARQAMETKRYGLDVDELVLVCEDDVKTRQPSSLASDLRQIAASARGDEDFILLHTQGNRCRSVGQQSQLQEELSRLWRGSTAAYLVSYSGLQKMASMPLVWHIDYQRNSRAYRCVCGPPLFDTYDSKLPPVLFGQSWTFWQRQPIVRLGSLTLRARHFIFLVGCLLLGARLRSIMLQKHCAALLGGAFFGALVFFDLEIFWYRCSHLTAIFGCAFPLLVLATSEYFWVLLGAYSMLTFYLIHWLTLEASEQS